MIRFWSKIKSTENTCKKCIAAEEDPNKIQETKKSKEIQEEKQSLIEEEEQGAKEQQIIEEQEENLREEEYSAEEKKTVDREKPAPPAKGRTPSPRSSQAKKIRKKRTGN